VNLFSATDGFLVLINQV